VIAVGVAIHRIQSLERNACQIFCGRYPVEDDGFVSWQTAEKVDDRVIASKGQKGVVPGVDQVCFGQVLDLRKIHDHPVGGIACLVDDTARQGNFDDVTMPVQVTALTLVVWDAVACIEFEAPGDQHGRNGRQVGLELYNAVMLTTDDHRRDSAGLRYVYPVISRRAGGVSVGINLNVNNACNWACLYCQVDNLTRGGPPAIDLAVLERELSGFLDEALHGDFMLRHVPAEARHLMDIAFSGNGEPTSAAEFADAVRCVGKVLEHFGLRGKLMVRLITNGSLMHRPSVQEGVGHLGELGGEVWFKLDRATADEVSEINGVPFLPEKTFRNLEVCVGLAPTYVQTCWFALDDQAPSAASRAAYCEFLRPLASRLSGIHLYGLARPSLQPAAPRLARLPESDLQAFAAQINEKTGIRVVVSP